MKFISKGKCNIAELSRSVFLRIFSVLLLFAMFSTVSVSSFAQPKGNLEKITEYYALMRRVLDSDYVDPSSFLIDIDSYLRTKASSDNDQELIDDAEAFIEFLHTTSYQLGRYYKGDYDRIRGVCKYVSEYLFYNYDHFYNGTKMVKGLYECNCKYRYGTCLNYSALCYYFLQELGIPCIRVFSQNHAYNAAYDSEAGRWIYFDSTWCSGNYLYYGRYVQGDFRDTWFDISDELFAEMDVEDSQHSHRHSIEFTQNGVYFKLNNIRESTEGMIYSTTYMDTSDWYISYTAGSPDLAAALPDDIAGFSLKESDVLYSSFNIEKEPKDAIGGGGQICSFSVTARNNSFSDDSLLRYQWYYSRDNGVTWISCGPSGTSKKYLFPASSLWSGCLYRCEVTNECGVKLTTDSAQFTYIVYCRQGEEKVFTCPTKDGGIFTWQYSSDNGRTWKQCTDTQANGSRISIAASASNGGRIYRCVSQNGSDVSYYNPFIVGVTQ